MNNVTKEKVAVQNVIGAGPTFLDQPGIHNAFLGISLDKPTSDRHLGLYVQWAINSARHCPIMIDDIEARHNYVVLKGMGEEQAKSLALSRGEEFAVRLSKVVAGIAYSYRTVSYRQDNPDDHKGHAVSIKRSSERYVEDRLLDPLVTAYAEDETFRSEVEGQVERSLGDRLKAWESQVSGNRHRQGRERLARFVLEETAVTIGLIQRGSSVELYNGSPIQVVVDLYDPETNKYPTLREALETYQKYGHISLAVESS